MQYLGPIIVLSSMHEDRLTINLIQPLVCVYIDDVYVCVCVCVCTCIHTILGLWYVVCVHINDVCAHTHTHTHTYTHVHTQFCNFLAGWTVMGCLVAVIIITTVTGTVITILFIVIYVLWKR